MGGSPTLLTILALTTPKRCSRRLPLFSRSLFQLCLHRGDGRLERPQLATDFMLFLIGLEVTLYRRRVRFLLFQGSRQLGTPGRRLHEICLQRPAKSELLAGGGDLKEPCLRIGEGERGFQWMYESGNIIG